MNRPVAKILAVHTGGKEAKEADSDTAKGLLLVRRACIMLTANLFWTEAELVNGSMELFKTLFLMTKNHHHTFQL